jgi:hypothetical protein
MSYEPPSIEERVEVGAGLIGLAGSPPPTSPAWRRGDDEAQETP